MGHCSGETAEPRAPPLPAMPSADVLNYSKKNGGGAFAFALAQARAATGKPLSDPSSKA